jgi:hypothetical protein
MKVPFGRLHAKSLTSNDPVEAATLRYKAAYHEYHGVVDRNAELRIDGVKPSEESILEEEVALEKLDCAQHALLEATALAHPTVH